MSTADTDALTGTHDLIVNAIWNAANGRPIPFNPDDLAAAVLPIVAAEVQAAKAEAWGEYAAALEAVPDYAPTEYDRGRVDQRHATIEELHARAARRDEEDR